MRGAGRRVAGSRPPPSAAKPDGDPMRAVASGILIGIGVLHSVVGVIDGWPTIRSMFRLGYWNSVERVGANLLLWFMTAGVLLILLGSVGWWVERELDRPLPQALGWAILAFTLVAGAAVGNLVFPAILFVPAAVIIVVRARQHAGFTRATV